MRRFLEWIFQPPRWAREAKAALDAWDEQIQDDLMRFDAAAQHEKILNTPPRSAPEPFPGE